MTVKMSLNDMNSDKENVYTILEGITSVSACIKSMDEGVPSRDIAEILVDSSKVSGGGDRFRRRLAYLRAKSAEYGFAVRECSGDELATLTSGTTHGGIAARVGQRKIKPLDAANISPHGFYMLFDGIEDPYSFGYSLRSLYAAGADGVIIPGGHLISADSTISRSSAGAYELLPVYSADGGAVDAVGMFRAAGYRILCSGIRDSVSYLDAGLSRPLVIVMGGEKRGISSSLAAVCDGCVCIGYGRQFMGSLSTACAVSVLAFEVLRNSGN